VADPEAVPDADEDDADELLEALPQAARTMQAPAGRQHVMMRRSADKAQNLHRSNADGAST
jgi:hypothetical protein